MKKSLALAFAAALVTIGLAAGADDSGWQIDKAHSTIGFSVKHLGISKVRGDFGNYSAAVRADDQGRLTSVSATVNANSVNTGIGKRDEHLRQSDFFDSGKYPKVKLKTKSIKWKGDNFTGTADLTIKGKTRSVPFKGELLGIRKANFGGGETLRAGYSVTAKINRKDFDLGFNALAEGVSIVSDIVNIELEIEIARPV